MGRRVKNNGWVDGWMNGDTSPSPSSMRTSNYYRVFKVFTFFCFILISVASHSQKLIMEEIPEKIFEPPVYGLKGKHYVHLFYEGNFLFGPNYSDSLKTNTGKSLGWNFGFRYKLKIAKRICWITDVSYRLQSFNIKQNNNGFPDSLSYKKEKLNFNQICLSPALRIIYGRKKRSFGRYIDIGATGAWNFETAHFTKQIYKPANAGFREQTIRVREKHLSYTMPFETDIFFVLGYEKVQFKFQYRLTDYFSNYNGKRISELPRFMFGLNIALLPE